MVPELTTLVAFICTRLCQLICTLLKPGVRVTEPLCSYNYNAVLSNFIYCESCSFLRVNICNVKWLFLICFLHLCVKKDCFFFFCPRRWNDRVGDLGLPRKWWHRYSADCGLHLLFVALMLFPLCSLYELAIKGMLVLQTGLVWSLRPVCLVPQDFNLLVKKKWTLKYAWNLYHVVSRNESGWLCGKTASACESWPSRALRASLYCHKVKLDSSISHDTKLYAYLVAVFSSRVVVSVYCASLCIVWPGYWHMPASIQSFLLGLAKVKGPCQEQPFPINAGLCWHQSACYSREGYFQGAFFF